MTLSDKIHKLIAEEDERPEATKEAADLVLSAPDSGERNGLLALMYHEGIGVDTDLDKCFEYAEKAAFKGNDGLGYFLLGYMCDNAETPDQAEGGPRQKYDHYDAERFYETCSKIDSRWREEAIIWLGDYYMDSAQGGDPEIAIEYYESIAENNAEAAGRLSDRYWDLTEYMNPEDDPEVADNLFKWTTVAEKLNPEDYSYRLGTLYACGIGCKKDYHKAIDFFSAAYSYDDWRGAQAIAATLDEYLEDNPDISSVEREKIENEIGVWLERAEEMHKKEILENPDEQDNAIEED